MPEIIIFAEGPTEEQFIKKVLAPSLRNLGVYLKPQLLNTSPTAKGGAINFDRLCRNARNTLRQYPNAFLSTFIDLYALATDFPEFDASKGIQDVYQRVAHLELALKNTVAERVGCDPNRFIPHIQPYEYEGLLFSNVKRLAEIEPAWNKALPALQKIRANFANPEHINDGYDTKPSKRLENLLRPKYKKTSHGPRAAIRITLETMERECPHFKHWVDHLRSLAQPL